MTRGWLAAVLLDWSTVAMRWLLSLAVVASVVLGGCIYRTTPPATEQKVIVPEPLVAAPSASPMSVPESQRVVRYAEGRYELHGDGTAASPYFWVWVPTGATAPVPPPLPRR